MSDDRTEEYDRQPGETDLAWAAFVAFRSLPGKGRVQSAVVAQGFKKHSVIEWAKKWCWRDRARSWDIDQDRLYRIWLMEERKKIAEENVKIGTMAVRRAAQSLSNMDGAKLKPTEAARIGEFGLKMQQMAVGSADAPADTVEQEGRKALRVEDPDALLEAYKDPAVRAMARELADRIAGRSPSVPREGAEPGLSDGEADVAPDGARLPDQ